MNKFLMITVAVLSMLSAARAEEPKVLSFYEQKVDREWTVYGKIFDGSPRCAAELSFANGDLVHFDKNLEDGSFDINMRNVRWELEHNVDDKLQLQLNAYKGSNFLKGGSAEWVMPLKNTIVIPIDVGPLNWLFMHADNIRIVMPGNTSNVHFSFLHGPKIAKLMIECINKYEDVLNEAKLDRTPSVKPPEKDMSPAAIKERAKKEI